MSFSESRRRFLFNLGALAAASALPAPWLTNQLVLSSHPRSDAATTTNLAEMRFGYASITWEGNDRQAIADISEVGFRGIQLRANILDAFNHQPAAVSELLKQHGLQFVALSGGGPNSNEFDEAKEIAELVKRATFLRDAGGMYLQVTDSARPKNRPPAAADFNRLGRLLTEVGKRTADLGIQLAYHNHMGSLGEAPAEVDAIMAAADARYVKLLLDVAHYTQGGGDPAKAIRKYRERTLFLHIKDVESIVPSATEKQSKSYRFVELGRGRVDLPAVFAALNAIKFRGWAIVELDGVPDKARTPKESAIISKRYLQEKLRMTI